MLTQRQVDHFGTFGFVVLPRFLGADRAVALRDEVDTALRDAYAATYEERVIDGISGHYLPMASRCTPLSSSLVCDDPLLIDAAELLLGGPVIPECPEGILFFSESGWHNDDGIGVAGVKFITYFDRLTARNGALRLLPGSHRPEETARLERERSRCRGSGDPALAGPEPFDPPGYVANSALGDVIAFDVHTWHASTGGTDRLAWSLVYQPCPDDDEDRERTRRSMLDSFEQGGRGFDRDRYPIWRDWIADAADHPSRTRVLDPLRAAGVLDLAGADIGW